MRKESTNYVIAIQLWPCQRIGYSALFQLSTWSLSFEALQLYI